MLCCHEPEVESCLVCYIIYCNYYIDIELCWICYRLGIAEDLKEFCAQSEYYVITVTGILYLQINLVR